MKIFNWVHRKLHHNAIKDDDLARDMKNEVESQTLLPEMGLLDAAILTIGTFGFDPSKLPSCHQHKHFQIPYQQQQTEDEQEEEDHSDDGDKEEDEDNESEVNPLVFTTLKHKFDFDQVMSPESNKEECDTNIDGAREVMMSAAGDDEDDERKRGGRRTTLADLFLADSDHVNSVPTISVHNKPKEEADFGVKSAKSAQNKKGLSFSKKLIPQVGDKSQPIKKLNQMMKRMMKRKVHPEVYQGKAIASKNMDGTELEANIDHETAYLLPIPA